MGALLGSVAVIALLVCCLRFLLPSEIICLLGLLLLASRSLGLVASWLPSAVVVFGCWSASGSCWLLQVMKNGRWLGCLLAGAWCYCEPGWGSLPTCLGCGFATATMLPLVQGWSAGVDGRLMRFFSTAALPLSWVGAATGWRFYLCFHSAGLEGIMPPVCRQMFLCDATLREPVPVD